MEDNTVIEDQSGTPPETEQIQTEQDPFALDETKFASLSPEQRASLDPVLNEWKERARGEIEKTRTSYKPYEEKAKSLDQLTQDPRFQNWYRSLSAPQQQQVQQAQQAQVASPEEYALAVQEAASGNPQRMMSIQQRMMSEWARPTVEALQSKQDRIEMQMELNDLFTSHPDARDLDSMGRDVNNPNDTRQSLLEICMHYVKDINGGTLEQAYNIARAIAGSSNTRAKQQALGMLQDKKQTITAGNSTSNTAASTVFVDSAQDLLSKGIEALMSGSKTKYAVKR